MPEHMTDTAISSDIMLSRSPDIAAMVEYWDLTDTIVDGVAAVRLAGERYLPRFTDEEQQDYNYRLSLTKMTNVYRDTLEGLASKPFEDEVSLVADGNTAIPQRLIDFMENVDGSGNNITIFSSATFFNGINSAVDWIFIDFDKPDPSVVSIADAKRVGQQPYWSHVLARNVLDVKSKMINGKEVFTYVKILEPGKPDRVRVFERNAVNGTVGWQLYEKSDRPGPDGKTVFLLIDSGEITIGVIPMVPFVTGRRDGRSWRVFPAMRDAADLQIELYQQESGLKFAKTLTAYPMLAGNGIKPPTAPDGKTVERIRVGPNRVLYAPPNPSGGQPGSWSYVEPAAQSLQFLADDVKETINQLRELGRQPLTAQSGNLTVVTTQVAAGKAKSAVKAWAYALKDTLENALMITNMWFGTSDEYQPTVSVYTEFDEFMEGKDLDALLAARTNKDISRETYWDELRRRGVLSPEFKADDEEQRLLEELPGDGPDNATADA